MPAASAHVLIACDLLVAAGPEALALYAKDRTEAVGNGDLQPTADLVFDRDARFDAGAMARRIAGGAPDLRRLRRRRARRGRLGDAIFANMIMLGFAWQKGLVPVSARALYRAITAQRRGPPKRTCRPSRPAAIAAYDPATRATESPPDPETLPLDALIAQRTARTRPLTRTCLRPALPARRRGPRRRGAAGRGGPEPRRRGQPLQADGVQGRIRSRAALRRRTLRRELGKTFTGGQAKVWLAPPLSPPRTATGVRARWRSAVGC